MAGFYNISNLKHDEGLAKALGNMVIAWAYAEHALMATLACILNSDLNMIEAGYYRIPTFEARTKLIRTLISEWKTTEYDKEAMAHTVSKLAKLSIARNGWIHGVWCSDGSRSTTVIFDFRAASTSLDRRRPVKSADVENHIAAVNRRTNELLALVHAWLDKYFGSLRDQAHLQSPPPESSEKE